LHKWRPEIEGRSRKNNDHWKEDEMIELVDGVSRKGIGRWSKVKGDYFSTSIRTAVHLKVARAGQSVIILCSAMRWLDMFLDNVASLVLSGQMEELG
jgi:hypothetical protein